MSSKTLAIPLYDRVLVKRISEKEMTRGGIIIPDNAKEKPVEGVIVSVGIGRIMDDGEVRPLAVKVDDHILFGKYSGQEVRIGLEDYLILREDEILCQLKIILDND